MAWKCHDDLTGGVIEGEPRALAITLDGTALRTYDVAPDDLAVLLQRLGHDLVQDAALEQLANGRDTPQPEPPPPTPAPEPAPSAPSAPSAAPVDGADLTPDPDPDEVDPADETTARLKAVLVYARTDAEEPDEASPALTAEAMLLDTDRVWTPRAVSEETGLSLAEARAVLAKVRREQGGR